MRATKVAKLRPCMRTVECCVELAIALAVVVEELAKELLEELASCPRSTLDPVATRVILSPAALKELERELVIAARDADWMVVRTCEALTDAGKVQLYVNCTSSANRRPPMPATK